jgi:hypothetical protein
VKHLFSALTVDELSGATRRMRLYRAHAERNAGRRRIAEISGEQAQRTDEQERDRSAAE